MYSRRHPFLFFILIFSAIVGTSVICISLAVSTAIKLSNPDVFSNDREKVGVVDVKGYIADTREVIEDISQYREDHTIKAIVLRIDSPGGGVGPSQEVYREIQKTLPFKKVIASCGAVAASGGYYIAAAADGIVANPGTITGSIGVIMGYTDIQGLLQKIGISPVVIKSGQYKDIGSPVRSMTAFEKTILQNFSDQIHRQFITAVSDGRHLEYEKVAAVADGRIISGETAVALGLVDRLGDLEDAIEWAGQLGGISGKPAVVYARDKKLSFFKRLAESAVHDITSQIAVNHLSAEYVQ